MPSPREEAGRALWRGRGLLVADPGARCRQRGMEAARWAWRRSEAARRSVNFGGEVAGSAQVQWRGRMAGGRPAVVECATGARETMIGEWMGSEVSGDRSVGEGDESEGYFAGPSGSRSPRQGASEGLDMSRTVFPIEKKIRDDGFYTYYVTWTP